MGTEVILEGCLVALAVSVTAFIVFVGIVLLLEGLKTLVEELSCGPK